MQNISAELIGEKINELRKQDVRNFQTNYFFTTLSDNVLYKQNQNAIIFLAKEKSFYKLYYALTNILSFSELLAFLPDEEIYLEIVARQEIEEDFSQILDKFFEYQTTYQKLYKKLEVLPQKYTIDCRVDVDLVFEKLYSTFDVRFEHLMAKEELVKLNKDNKVLTIYENDEMKSFLIYKTQGSKAYLNQIANYGSKENLINLWKVFYQALNNDNITYVDLWYNKQNKKAENMYKIENFQPLKMFNYCYKKL